MTGHSEVILGPNFPVVTWTYSGVRGEVVSDGFHIYEYAVSQDVDRFA
jgi:hypothetical protein